VERIDKHHRCIEQCQELTFSTIQVISFSGSHDSLGCRHAVLLYGSKGLAEEGVLFMQQRHCTLSLDILN
jgi:hypothetical protein